MLDCTEKLSKVPSVSLDFRI